MKRTSKIRHAKRMTSSSVEGSVPIRLQNQYSPIAPDDDDDDLCTSSAEEDEFPLPETRMRKRFLVAQKGTYYEIFFPIPSNSIYPPKKAFRIIETEISKLKMLLKSYHSGLTP